MVAMSNPALSPHALRSLMRTGRNRSSPRITPDMFFLRLLKLKREVRLRDLPALLRRRTPLPAILDSALYLTEAVIFPFFPVIFFMGQRIRDARDYAQAPVLARRDLLRLLAAISRSNACGRINSFSGSSAVGAMQAAVWISAYPNRLCPSSLHHFSLESVDYPQETI